MIASGEVVAIHGLVHALDGTDVLDEADVLDGTDVLDELMS